MLNSVERYNKFAGSSPTDFDGSSTDSLSGTVVSFQDLTAAEPRIVHILVVFTWLSESPTISRSVKIREDANALQNWKQVPERRRVDSRQGGFRKFQLYELQPSLRQILSFR